MLAVALAIRVYLVLVSPPGSDVYYYDTQAAQLILQGVNPYGHQFTGIPPALATPGAQDVFAYLPFTALFVVPFYLLGNIKFATVAADLIIGICLFQFSRKWSLPLAALFLLVPLTYYTNNATLGTAFVAASLALESRGRRLLSSVALGVALATSLFVWLAFPFFAWWYAKRDESKGLLVALGTFAAITVPFVAAGPSDFLYDVLFFQLGRPAPGLLSSGWTVGFNLNPSLSGLMVSIVGQPAPLYLRAGLSVVALVVLLFARPRDDHYAGRSESELESSMLLRSALFVAVAVFVIPTVFFFAYAEFPIVLFLVWLARQ